MRNQQWILVYALWQEIPKLVYAFWTLQPVYLELLCKVKGRGNPQPKKGPLTYHGLISLLKNITSALIDKGLFHVLLDIYKMYITKHCACRIYTLKSKLKEFSYMKGLLGCSFMLALDNGRQNNIFDLINLDPIIYIQVMYIHEYYMTLYTDITHRYICTESTTY